MTAALFVLGAIVCAGVMFEDVIRHWRLSAPETLITNLVHNLGPDDRVPIDWLAPRVQKQLSDLRDRARMRP